MNQNSESTGPVGHPKNGKASRWFRGIFNIVRSKLKGTSNRIHEKESSSEASTDSSSEENITFDSFDVDQKSSTSFSSDDNSVIKVVHSPDSMNIRNQPSTSTSIYPRSDSSSQTRTPIPYQDLSAKYKPSSNNGANETRRYSSRAKLFNYGLRPSYSSLQPIHQQKPRANLLYSKKFHSPLPSKCESNSKKDADNHVSAAGSLLVTVKSDSWSLAHGDVSPKKFEDSSECTKEELYSPLKYVRMEVDNEKVSRRDEQKPKGPQNHFGILAHEQSPDRRNGNGNDKSTTGIDPDRELEKLFFTSLRTVETLTKIMVDILALKNDST